MKSNVTKLFEIWRTEQVDNFDRICPAMKKEEQLFDVQQELYHRWIESVPDMARITGSSFDKEQKAWDAWNDQYCAWKEALNGLLISGTPLPYADVPSFPDITSGETHIEENVQTAFDHAVQALHTERSTFCIWTDKHRQWAEQSRRILKLRLSCLEKAVVQTNEAETIFSDLSKNQEELLERSAAARETFVNWRNAHGIWRTTWVQWLYLFTTEKYRQAEKTYYAFLDEDLYWKNEHDIADQLYRKYVVGDYREKIETAVSDSSDPNLPATVMEKTDSGPVCMDDDTERDSAISCGSDRLDDDDEEDWDDGIPDEYLRDDDSCNEDEDGLSDDRPMKDDRHHAKEHLSPFITGDRMACAANEAIQAVYRAHFDHPEKIPDTDLEALNILSNLLAAKTASELQEHFSDEAEDVENLLLGILIKATEKATLMSRKIFSRKDVRAIKSLWTTLYPSLYDEYL